MRFAHEVSVHEPECRRMLQIGIQPTLIGKNHPTKITGFQKREAILLNLCGPWSVAHGQRHVLADPEVCDGVLFLKCSTINTIRIGRGIERLLQPKEAQRKGLVARNANRGGRIKKVVQHAEDATGDSRQ